MDAIKVTKNQTQSAYACGKVRIYSEDSLKVYFFWTGNEYNPNSLCILCLQVTVNESMKPERLARRFKYSIKMLLVNQLNFSNGS
jgi:hypothetical protein